MIGEEARLRSLVEAGIALTSELSLDAVLTKLVESAARLTEARYAALGVVDRSGTGLERFLTTGVTQEQIGEIGHFPSGRGILGVLIRDAAPLRLHDLTEDPRSAGFPPGHPPMRSFLGVPVLLRGAVYGNLYLTEKEGGADFTEDDEEVLRLFASQAAVAIENARLYESATGWLSQLRTLAEVGDALTGEMELPRLLRLIATRLRELLSARLVMISVPTPEGDLRVEAAADAAGTTTAIGLRLDLERSKSGRVLGLRHPERVDSLIDDPEVDHDFLRAFVARAGGPVPAAGLFVPLVVRDRPIGVVAVHDKLVPERPRDLRFTDEDLRLAELFAERASVAIDLSERIQRDALRRVVEAQELERKRLARELHDETGQALTSILLGLRTLEQATTEEERGAATAALREITVATLQDVRRLAVELRPAALDDFGLVPALRRLAEGFGEQVAIEVHVEARLQDRLPPEVEIALYRIVQEALTNVLKHARARNASIVLTRRRGTVSVLVEDDGRGFTPGDAPGAGLGLLGMRERIALLDGTITVESSPGAGTSLVAEVPLP